MKKIIVSFFLSMMAVLSLGTSLNSALDLSKNPSTLIKAKDEILNVLLTEPSSLTVLNAAKKIYSKTKILDSSEATSEKALADSIVSENMNVFYSTLSSTSITELPDYFDLLFNVLPISQNYDRFFQYLSESDYTDAVKSFSNLKYLYKVPNLKEFLPTEDIPSIWDFLVQTIQQYPDVFDTDAAKFIASVSTQYDVKNLYVKTYVWLSGLSVSQAQWGFNVINFESTISDVSGVKMDPNLLQWKYTTSSYLALDTSVTDATRQLSTTRDMTVFVKNAPIFYKAVQSFPDQYKKELSSALGIYLDMLLQKVSLMKFEIPSEISDQMRKLASEFPCNSNASKLLAIALTAPKENPGTPKASKSSSVRDHSQKPGELFSWVYYTIVIVILVGLISIPGIRTTLYRVLKMRKRELMHYMRRLSKNPEDPQLHAKIAEIYESMGRYEEAHREYSVAMKLVNVERGEKK